MKLGLVDQIVKILPGMQEVKVQSMTQEDPLEKETATTRVFLLGEFHGQRTLVDYSPWGCKELAITKRLTYTHTDEIMCMTVWRREQCPKREI